MQVAELVLIGVGVTLEPLPLAGFILVLISQDGVRKGAAFVTGWVVCLALVVALTLVVTGGRPPQRSSSPGMAVSATKALLGAVLLAAAVHRYRRPRPATGPPRWAMSVDRLPLAGAALLAAALQPWVLVAAGACAVADLHVSTPASVALLVAFCLLGTATQLAMELYAVLHREAAGDRLETIRRGLVDHRERVAVAIAAVIGLWLLGQGISAIVSA